MNRGRYVCSGLVALAGALLLLLGQGQAVQGQPADDVLGDPLALGAWLYEGNCTRCHGDYAADRLGRAVTPKELKNKIAGKSRSACAVDWAIAEGGPLASKEIDAIVAYMAAWEAAGAAPALPPLPPQPTATPTSAVDATPSVAPSPAGTPAILAAPAGPDAELAALLGEDPIYAGAWIYSQNCYRCHLGYERARMGNAATLDVVRETVTQGKVTAGMPAFSFTRGGPLKRSEIDALLAYISAWEAQGAPPPLPQALAEAIASRLPAVTTVVTPTVTTPAVTTPAVALAVAPLPAPGPTAPASAAPVAASASGVTWQVAANGLRLAFYCLLGVPLLLLVLIGGLLASQIGYRGRQDV